MRYLVATDGSTVSDAAVEHAAREASVWDADLEIVHVLTPSTTPRRYSTQRPTRPRPPRATEAAT
jgi:nucleotide-binding universal stress UspA family protein